MRVSVGGLLCAGSFQGLSRGAAPRALGFSRACGFVGLGATGAEASVQGPLPGLAWGYVTPGLWCGGATLAYAGPAVGGLSAYRGRMTGTLRALGLVAWWAAARWKLLRHQAGSQVLGDFP